jgi:hypothetical protein
MEPRLEHQSITIKRLIQDYRDGRIVIPEFQREYVWKKSRAPHLMDSLYRGYPISSLLLWNGSGSTIPRRATPRPARSAVVSWLIDGQQRVLTLAKCMSGDDGISVVFNPENNEFRLANAATRRNKSWYSLAEIVDDDAYRMIRRGLSDTRRDAREKKFDRVRFILNYEVPVVQMTDHPFEDAVAAFKRINTLGTKLKREDIQCAEVASRHIGFMAEKVAPFLEKMRAEGLNRLNVMHLFRACSAIARPEGKSRLPLHDLSRPELEAAWKRTKRGTREALNLVRSELGLVNMDILWSGALLVPLIVVFGTTEPHQRNCKEMVAWLASAALLHRLRDGTDSSLDRDLKASRSNDPVGELLANVQKLRGSIKALPDDFARTLGDRGGLLGVYIACYHRGIRDLFSDGRVILQGGVERHHILPRAQFEESARSSADCVANIAFVSAGTNRAASNNGPEVYLKKSKKDTLESQCIPTDTNLWRIERAAEFWAARKEMLAEAFNDFVRGKLGGRKL